MDDLTFITPAPCLHFGATIRCPCGAHAYTVTRPIYEGAPHPGMSFAHPDGTPVQDGEAIQCPACGRPSEGPGMDGVLR